MDNTYLSSLIKEAQERGGGLILNFEDKPAVVVLTVDRYNNLLNQAQNGFAAPVADEVNPISDVANLPVPTPKLPQKVLVTGGAGYIGSHLVRELIKGGYEVVILDNLSTGKKENLHPNAIFIEGDIADRNLLRDVFATNQFAAVFHMAASLEVGESVREPQKYFENNLINTCNLLDAMREADCKKIIFSSSAAVYGEAEKVPITENSGLRPSNPYGSTKLLAERCIKYYCEYLGFQAVVFRYFNACGFDPEAKIIPTHHSHLIYNVIQVAKGVQPHLEIFGNDYNTFDGTCIRDYVHVLDIVRPHILALQKMSNGNKFEVYNIGTGQGFSVDQVVNCASEVLNKIIPMEIAPRRAGDPPSLVADNTKLLHGLGYVLTNSTLENMIRTSWEGMKEI